MSERALLLRLAREIEALHQPRTEVTYRGLRPDWDGTATADISVAMNRHEQTVCTAGCGEWPCDTLRVVRRG